MLRAVLVRALLTCASLWAFATGTASASQLRIEGNEVVYEAAGGEANAVSVTKEGAYYLFTDTGFELDDTTKVTITPDGDCGPVDADTARCPADDIVTLRVGLGDRPDTFEIIGDAYPPLDPNTVGPLVVSGDAERDVLIGGNGIDQFHGGPGNDELRGGDGPDALGGDEGVDLVLGGSGDDTVNGGDDVDTLDAGPGDDEFVNGGAGNDTIDGGDGDDAPVGGEGDDTVRGGPGDDRLDAPTFEAGGADTLEGGPGDDYLAAGIVDDDTPLAADTFLGGDGTDTADFSRRVDPLRIDTDGVADDGEAGEHDNVGADVERILGGAEGDTLTGDDGPELLDGGPGGDQLDGLGGNDTLEGGINSGDSDSLAGGDGNDTLRGGAGDDSLNGGAGTDDLRGGGGSDALTGEAGVDTLAGGPGLDALDGGEDDDTLLGGDEVLVGADGADDLLGGPGNDALAGGPGNDRLDGGLGADRLTGDAGRDAVSYEDRNARITVTFDGLPNDGEDGEGDNVASDVEIVISGAVADTLAGDGRENELNTASGDDFADPGAGLDRVFGGTGADVLRARDNGRDIVDCGPGEDLAIVDRQDTARDCETVDRGTRRKPKYRRLALVQPQGNVRLRIPDANRFVPFSDRSAIPLGSSVDARDGGVTLATRAGDGAVLEGRFEGGRFAVRQSRGANPVTELRLPRLPARDCRARAASGRARAARPIDRLVSTVKPKPRRRGRVRTRTDHVSATARGTSWLTEVRCDGTLVRVTEGTVEVRDLVRDRTAMVRAGQSYLARTR
jgi:Ca2+-binding RTX toxin-like protein